MRKLIFYCLQVPLIVVGLTLVVTMHTDEYKLLPEDFAVTPHPHHGWFLGTLAAVSLFSFTVSALIGKMLGIPRRQIILTCALPAVTILLIATARILFT